MLSTEVEEFAQHMSHLLPHFLKNTKSNGGVRRVGEQMIKNLNGNDKGH